MHKTVAALRRRILRSNRFAWLIAVCLLAAPMLALADDDTPTDSTPVAETADETTSPADEAKVDEQKVDADDVKKQTSLDTPQQTVRTFLTAMKEKDFDTAITVLDFSDIDPLPDTSQQHEAAKQLKSIIDHMPIVDIEKISDATDGPPVAFPPEVEDSPLVLNRSDDKKWRFTPKTVSKLSSIYKLYIDRPSGASPSSPPETPPTETPTIPPTAPINDPAQPVVPTESVPKVPEHLQSARRAMRTLMDGIANRNYQKAVTALDFSKMDPEMGPYDQLSVARELKEIIDRLAPVDYAIISDAPDDPAFVFPPNDTSGVITISRNSVGVWRFSADTVASVTELYAIYKDSPVVNLSNEEKAWFNRELFLGNETWRIMFLFCSIFLSLLVGQIARSGMIALTQYREKRNKLMSAIVLKMFSRTSRPFCLLIGLRIGLDQLVLIDSVEKTADSLIKVVFLVVIGYVMFRLVDVIVEWLQQLALSTGSTLNDMLVPIVSTSLRLTVVILILVQVVMELSNQPPSTILAGLGAGGLALGLAAQDTIRNVFGSLMIYVDRPFELGDRVLFEGHDGPVESVGFRSTRIRTLDGHLVTVPNSEMAARTIKNIGKRPFIRRVMDIRIPYNTTPEKLREALAILRNLVSDHEGKKDTHPPRVFLHDFMESSLNIRVIYWYHPPDYWAYCDYGEKLNLQIVEQFAAANIEFAVPTKRLFVSNE